MPQHSYLVLKGLSSSFEGYTMEVRTYWSYCGNKVLCWDQNWYPFLLYQSVSPSLEGPRIFRVKGSPGLFASRQSRTIPHLANIQELLCRVLIVRDEGGMKLVENSFLSLPSSHQNLHFQLSSSFRRPDLETCDIEEERKGKTNPEEAL